MKHTLSLVLSTIALLLSPMVIFGQAPDLGTSKNFALFTAAGAFENVGAATVVIGDVGTNVGAFSAFPPGTLVGSIHVADPVTVQAKIDVDNAYADLAGRTCGSTIGVTMGSGQILTPDIYCTGAATTLNGDLILNAEGDPDAIFIFQIGGAFATGTFANVLLLNGANLCNVYWQINGAFTLGGGSLFVGTVIAEGAINLHSGSTLNGRALSTAGAISTQDNFVTMSLCQAPSITCAGAVQVSCDNLVPAPDITSVSVTTTCPGAYTVTFQSDVISNQSCTNQYTLTRTYLVTDACGETATCEQTILVDDQISPVFTDCPVTPIALGCNPPPTAAQAIAAAGLATDNCGVPVMSSVGGTVTGGCVQSQIWTVTATDICNNTATCFVTFTWTADTQPMIVDIPDYMLPGCTNPAWPASLTTTWTDNCGGGGNIVAVAGAITSNGCSQSRVYTFTVVGFCGAPDVETTVVTRTYDVTKPVFTSIPPNVTVQCDAVPPSSVAPIATDNCDASVTVTLLETRVNGACSDTYTLTRRWTAMDDCGNTRTASQRITVRDTQKPVFISVPGNITIQCSDPIPAMVLPIATDNCDASVTVTYVGQWFMNTTCPGNYQIMRSWSALDNCGNSTVAAQIIQVLDTQAPTFTNVPQSVTIECNQPIPPLTNPTATDNCGGYVQITYLGQVRTNGSCLYNFTLTRTWRARDLCGNSTTVVQVITVQDTQLPIFINPPMDITVQCECYCVPFPIAVAQDDCGSATVTYMGEVQSPGNCSTGFTLTRTWIASDLCGNTSIHTQVIHLCDVLPLLPPASEEREAGAINEKARDFQLRPNPTNDRLQIDLSQFVGEAVQIMIFSELGALVWEQQLKPAQEGVLEINLRRQAGIKDGVYQVMLQSGGKRYVKSLVLMQ